MPMLRTAVALGFIAALAAAGPAFAQADDSGADNLNSPSALRCSALAEVDQAALPTAIAYIAGYGSGERDAITLASVGMSTETAGDATPDATAATTTTADSAGAAQATPAASATTTTTTEAPQVPRSGGPSAAILPTIPVEAIAAACAQSPDSRVLDIITAQGVMNAQ